MGKDIFVIPQWKSALARKGVNEGEVGNKIAVQSGGNNGKRLQFVLICGYYFPGQPWLWVPWCCVTHLRIIGFRLGFLLSTHIFRWVQKYSTWCRLSCIPATKLLLFRFEYPKPSSVFCVDPFVYFAPLGPSFFQRRNLTDCNFFVIVGRGLVEEKVDTLS